jgi:TRAP-type mannitol/chloroaromatic compound transport system permease small subunit
MDPLVDSPVTSKRPQAVALPMYVEVTILLGSACNFKASPHVRGDLRFKWISVSVRELCTHLCEHPHEFVWSGFEYEHVCDFWLSILAQWLPIVAIIFFPYYALSGFSRILRNGCLTWRVRMQSGHTE